MFKGRKVMTKSSPSRSIDTCLRKGRNADILHPTHNTHDRNCLTTPVMPQRRPLALDQGPRSTVGDARRNLSTIGAFSPQQDFESRPRRVPGRHQRTGRWNPQSPPRTPRTRRRTNMPRWEELAVITAGLGISVVAALIVAHGV